jgi:dihydrofolate synthase/folylpolyglutamate synthase
MDYSEAMKYISGTSWFGAEPSLERIAALLDRLGNPQDSLRFVHIAGTNGKGSCAAMTASVLKAAGYRTGLFTSPYISRFNERMQINGKQIEDETIAGIVTEVQPAADAMDVHPTQFEMMTACAMLWFSREKCDIAVLETGLGGRFDATNVITMPEVAVIMNIGLDHTGILGSTVEQIAFEKAGIIKPGCDCVLYRQPENVMKVIRDICAERGAHLHTADFSGIEREFDSIDGQVFTYKGNAYAIPLLGDNQLRNAAVVIETVEVLRGRGWSIDQSDLEHGLYAVSWPARFEIISDDPFFVVDGGHNPQCAASVAENLKRYFPDQRRIILTGVMRDKDSRGIFAALNPLADEYICVTPANSPRALPAEELAELLKQFGKKTTVCGSIKDAVAEALAAAGEDGMICATGSMYIAGPVRVCFDLL